MRLPVLIFVLMGLVAILAAPGWAAEPTDQPIEQSDPSPFVVTLYFENDGTFVKRNNPTDRHYTNGVKITFAHQPGWAADLAPRLPFSPAADGQPLKTAAGYAFGQNIYTPDNIGVATLNPRDRPYAGWLYGGVYLQRATDSVFDHLELDIGIIGPSSLAEDVQTQVHEVFDEVKPRGWDNQLRDEPGINLAYQRKWRIALLTNGDGDIAQLIPQAGFTLGTVNRHANVGATFRIGVNLPDDFGPGRIEEPAAATGVARHRPLGGYVFLRVGGKAVEHNVFLEGNNFSSSHGVDPEPLLGELQVGLSVVWGNFDVGYSQTFLTREFKGQLEHDSFGGLTVSWTGRF
jgi:lipid A 3-O-deacylase